MGDNVHSGHRERAKKEFLERGIDENVPAHKILELLLFYCVPRIDTNPIAHSLINKYKTLSGVFDAPADELVKFNGITYNNVGLLKMILPLSRIIALENQSNKDIFRSYSEMENFLLAQYTNITVEKLSIMGIDADGKKVFFRFVSEGDITCVGVPMREIAKAFLETDATIAVIAHNHPKGTALPSKADIKATETIQKLLFDIGVNLIDHIIISKDDFVSLAQSNEYKYIFHRELNTNK